MFLGDVIVEAIPAFNCRGCAVESSYVTIGDVESFFEECDVGLWFVTPKASPPNPRVSLGGLFGRNYLTAQVINIEISLLEAVEFGFLASPWMSKGDLE